MLESLLSGSIILGLSRLNSSKNAISTYFFSQFQASDLLFQNGAEYPARILYSSPQYYSVEALEVRHLFVISFDLKMLETRILFNIWPNLFLGLLSRSFFYSKNFGNLRRKIAGLFDY